MPITESRRRELLKRAEAMADEAKAIKAELEQPVLPTNREVLELALETDQVVSFQYGGGTLDGRRQVSVYVIEDRTFLGYDARVGDYRRFFIESVNGPIAIEPQLPYVSDGE